MRIIGIDPGYAITGFGVIEYKGNHFKLIEAGAIETKKGVPFPNRLEKIYDDMMLLIEKHKPDAIAVEELFFILFRPLIFFPVFCGDLADDPGRISCNQCVRRNIADDD